MDEIVSSLYGLHIDELLSYHVAIDDFQVKDFEESKHISLIESQPSLKKKYITKDLIGIKSNSDMGFVPFKNQAPDLAFLFSFKAFYILRDMFSLSENQIKVLSINEFPFYFYVFPSFVKCDEPFPVYKKISQNLPENLHFFRKFENANYLIVTESFRLRWKESKLTGATFLLKWDGKHAYPRV